MERKHNKSKVKGKIEVNLVATGIILAILVSLLPFVFATPTGPSDVVSTANDTGTTSGGTYYNISGGTVSTVNLTATSQNPHWKAFVGNVTGKFTLDDNTGSTIYDWTLTSVTGEVYASRSSSVTWTNINCATASRVATEDSTLAQTGDDDINATFSSNNVKTFVVAGNTITAGNCSSTNTYVDNVSQATEFEELVLWASPNIVYATVLEPDEGGFNAEEYDFQMIVPDNGSSTWNGQIAYYIYVELG